LRYIRSMRGRRVLILPGLNDSGPAHWQTHWERQYGYTRVTQADWDRPARGDWLARLTAAVAAAPEPVILVAHSLGCALVAHFAAQTRESGVAAALLVAPADVEDCARTPDVTRCFAPLTLRPLGFRATVVASQDDSYVALPRARHFAACWGADFVDAGALGHINSESDLGSWPEGHRELERLAR
jgi:uncharacterized protein